ncbi:hypothetical protein [Myroides sp.]|uniref:hypothetical protein n=1 Tax=Myroides sp. TaxID=1874736 RepID=UPI0028A6101D|nr:hypothetical protein [Myroides sp.]
MFTTKTDKAVLYTALSLIILLIINGNLTYNIKKMELSDLKYILGAIVTLIGVVATYYANIIYKEREKNKRLNSLRLSLIDILNNTLLPCLNGLDNQYEHLKIINESNVFTYNNLIFGDSAIIKYNITDFYKIDDLIQIYELKKKSFNHLYQLIHFLNEIRTNSPQDIYESYKKELILNKDKAFETFSKAKQSELSSLVPSNHINKDLITDTMIRRKNDLSFSLNETRVLINKVVSELK